MKRIIFGNGVWGVPPETKSLVGFPDGKVRLRFRQNDFARVYVKTAGGIREFILWEENGKWSGREVARNATLEPAK